jgi:isoleucyl-tRNA synthetase
MEETDPSIVHVGDNNIHVFISREINRDLYLEGLAREIVRRIQIMRKEMNLEYSDRIIIFIEGDDEIMEALKSFRDYIERETLSTISNKFDNAYTKRWDIEGKDVLIGIKVVKSATPV